MKLCEVRIVAILMVLGAALVSPVTAERATNVVENQLPKPALIPAAEEYAAVTGDGAWCWFSEPRALQVNGKTYTGWVTTDGSVQVGELDGSNRPAKIFTLHEKFERDDHDNPAFLALPDGRIQAYYAYHGGGDLVMRMTEKPGDISAWTPGRMLGMCGEGKKRGVTYANPVRLSSENNRLYVFSRAVSWSPTVMFSDDLGQSWSKPQTVIPGLKGGRPYARYWDDGKGRIDILFTDAHPGGDAHPELGAKNRVHFVRYEKGAFWKADGTKIGTLETLPLDIEKADVVYDASAGRGWIWDVTEDAAGNPAVVYTRMPGDTKETMGLDHRYHYARWDGKQWVDHEIARVGRWFPQTRKGEIESQKFYSPGISLDKNNANLVYYSGRVGNRLEIVRALTADGGQSWDKVQLTRDSFNDNVRPITVRNATATSPGVMWLNLRYYYQYVDYDVSIRMDRPAIKPRISGDLTQAAILETAHAAADWQLDHPTRKALRTAWENGAFYNGAMALSQLPGGKQYEDAMLRMGLLNRWKIKNTHWAANDHCVGTAYCELYFKYKQEVMIKDLRKQFDGILNMPPKVMDMLKPGGEWRWSWCDALFMAPPTWIRMYTATQDKKYLEYMNSEWWAATEHLYDQEEHLFFRDSSYLWKGKEHPKKEANGKKVFWGRGNGWVYAGLALTLPYFPKDHPDYPRYVTLFKDMSAKVLQCQHPDGLWGVSLLDPATFPVKETSGSGFYCYGLAWGINNGFLDRATYEPALRKSWTALVGCVEPSGRIAYVQQVGQEPTKISSQGTEVYGAGAFIMAAAEMYKVTQ